jgi:hypothetical protein
MRSGAAGGQLLVDTGGQREDGDRLHAAPNTDASCGDSADQES